MKPFKGTFNSDAYASTANAVRDAGGNATFGHEKRKAAGLGLEPLVDPSGGGIYGITRLSLPRFIDSPGGRFMLANGMPILIETRVDTTGSMGENVNRCFVALPRMYKRFETVTQRYDRQLITSSFGDTEDDIILTRTQAEMAGKIAEQMTFLHAEGGGKGNGKEDPDLGLFAGAYFTKCRLTEYGLRTYDFTLSDEPCATGISHSDLVRVFGDGVFAELEKNGFPIRENSIPRTDQIVSDLQKKAHAFFLQVDNRPDVTHQWAGLYERDHVIMVPNIDLVPEIQATIIGLTEGTLTLSGLEEFLCGTCELSESNANQIIRAVNHIPIGAQTLLPNFSKLPVVGDIFREKTDLWPIGHELDPLKDKIADDKEKDGKPVGWI